MTIQTKTQLMQTNRNLVFGAVAKLPGGEGALEMFLYALITALGESVPTYKFAKAIEAATDFTISNIEEIREVTE